ncbi:hypothetical protein BC826DRAFT_994090, partial [Russula brevipes]
TDDTTSPSSATHVSEPVSSLSADIEQILQVLEQDIADDDADQDVGPLLRQLERADSIGQNVEGRMDAILDSLDRLLSTLQDDQTTDVKADNTGSQRADNIPGR